MDVWSGCIPSSPVQDIARSSSRSTHNALGLRRAAVPQDRSIREALVWLPNPPPPPPAWAALCSGVEVAGAAALHWALGWRRRRVPDVEGAAGDWRLEHVPPDETVQNAALSDAANRPQQLSCADN